MNPLTTEIGRVIDQGPTFLPLLAFSTIQCEPNTIFNNSFYVWFPLCIMSP
jgi:hypothetical protein